MTEDGQEIIQSNGVVEAWQPTLETPDLTPAQLAAWSVLGCGFAAAAGDCSPRQSSRISACLPRHSGENKEYAYFALPPACSPQGNSVMRPRLLCTPASLALLMLPFLAGRAASIRSLIPRARSGAKVDTAVQ